MPRSHARVVDELLRVRALEALGPLGDATAHAALEAGTVLVEHEVLAWEGSHGTMHAHRVVLRVDEDVHRTVAASHAAKDALLAAFAAAMAERPGQAVADVTFEVGAAPEPAGSSPYRDPRGGRS